MKNEIDKDRWVFIVVQNPGEKEEYLGFSNDREQFIPAFDNKEVAQGWSFNAPKDPSQKYEVQAIFLTELVREASESNYKVYILNQEGRTVETY